MPGFRLFLDSADPDAWARWLPTRLFYGVTTNPTILERAGRTPGAGDLAALVTSAFRYPVEELHLQCWGSDAATLIANGRALAALDRRIVVKVPSTFDGIVAVADLHARGIRTTLTAVHAEHQVVTAAAAGAAYVAPYFGRINDGGGDGRAAIAAMLAILRTSGGDTRLLVASLRGARDVALLAAAGCDTLTFGPAIAGELFSDARTTVAVDAFEASVRRSGEVCSDVVGGRPTGR